jgi:hypothetical protein
MRRSPREPGSRLITCSRWPAAVNPACSYCIAKREGRTTFKNVVQEGVLGAQICDNPTLQMTHLHNPRRVVQIVKSLFFALPKAQGPP